MLMLQAAALAATLVTACSYSPVTLTGAPPAATPGSLAARDPVTAARIYDVMRDMHADAFNPLAPPVSGASGPGGLYVNWRGNWNGDHSTAAASTGIQENGRSDQQTGSPPRHDPMTDLTYLVSLYAYQAIYPQDRRFAADATRMEPIVRQEFATTSYYRCWLYFQLRDLAQLRPAQDWETLAGRFATAVYLHYYNHQAGTITDPQHAGSYRTDYAAECGAMLIDAGHRNRDPALTAAGESTLTHLLRRAQNPRTSLFPLQMRLGPRRDTVIQAEVMMGSEAQLLGAYLDAYDLTRNPAYLDAVIRAVNSLYSPGTGLWDKVHGGFFAAVDSDGSHLNTHYKEVRQAWMLPVLTQLTRIEHGGVWAARQQQMLIVVRDKLWQPGITGYPYRETPDFTIYQSSDGPRHSRVTEDWVTSEAMGIACESLASQLIPLALAIDSILHGAFHALPQKNQMPGFVPDIRAAGIAARTRGDAGGGQRLGHAVGSLRVGGDPRPSERNRLHTRGVSPAVLGLWNDRSAGPEELLPV
jgi:hypothetical protein